MKKVSVIILNWNGKKHLRDCLLSIRRDIYPHREIIVIDQGSKDGSVEMLEKEFPEVILIQNKENLGIPKATNMAFRIADGDYLLLLGNDTIVGENCTENLVKVMESNNRICSVSATLISSPLDEYLKHDIDIEKSNVSSVAMLMKRKTLDHIGYYDEENFSPYGGDETDWNYRARNVGYKIIETRRCAVVHVGGVDTKKQNPNQYLLLNEHRLKAMLYTLSFFDFTKRIPGLGLIFLNSIKEGKTLIILKSYWNNVKNWENVLRERRKRKEIARRLREEQKVVGEKWF